MIKNYRLIKKKKDGTVGLPPDIKRQRQRDFVRNAAKAKQTGTVGVLDTDVGGQSKRDDIVSIFSPVADSVDASDAGVFLTSVAPGAAVQPELPHEPIFESNIRVSNSIISPHTFKFSTHIGPLHKMKWGDVAELPLEGIGQDTFIATLDGKSIDPDAAG